jgi:Arsenical resistance operon protein ArsD
MKSIQVYDPAMCCSTGICGTGIDPALVRFASLLKQLSAAGVQVQRHNLGQRPLEFVLNRTVKALLETEGNEALPVIFVDGTIQMKGRYPDEAECEEWLHVLTSKGASV